MFPLAVMHRGMQETPPTSFSPVTSTNVGATTKSFWLLVLTLLIHLYQISRSCLVPIPNYWTYIKSSSQKVGVSGQILIKSRLRLVSFSQRSSYQTLVTWPHLQYNLSHMMKLFWWRHGQRLWRHNPCFKITLF